MPEMKLRLVISVLVAILFSPFALAQPNPLVGAWERVYQTNEKGEVNRNPSMLVIFSEDGVFCQINIAKGRPKVDKPVGELTNEEFRSRFTGVQAVYGTYVVKGDRLIRNVVGALNPNNEGQQITDQFKVSGDSLIALDPTTKAESRFKRVRNGSLSPR